MPNHTPISVAVHGAAGRVGREVLRAVSAENDMYLIAGIDQVKPEEAPILPPNANYFSSFSEALERAQPDVLVDFTNSEALMQIAPTALRNGIHLVIGSTGFAETELSSLETLSKEHSANVIYAPNFALGAVLLTKLAQISARFFSSASVSEEHHEGKGDAPSGTAIAIAEAIAQGKVSNYQRPLPKREPIPGTTGGDYHGISIHSSRMLGKLAHHQVTFGAPGQTLSIRHDTIDRECYMPGVLLAIRRIQQLNGLTIGLGNLLEI